MQIQEQIRNKVTEVVELANQKYGFNIPADNIDIKFKNAGRAAASASRRRRFGVEHYGLEFSLESARLDMVEMLEDTIPHEVAHLVCFFDTSLGSNHDYGWQRVCIGLGGSGNRTHNQTLSKAKYRKQYLYRTDGGYEVIIKSAKQHNRIQRGATYTTRATRESFGINHFVRIISSEEHRRNHQAQVQAAAMAAGVQSPTISTPSAPPKKTNTPKKRTVRKSTGGASKKEQALVIVQDVFGRGHGRATTIQRLMDVLDMSKAGASTYFYNAKKELGL